MLFRSATTELLRASGTEVHAQLCDVRKGDQVEALAKAAMQRFGAVHLVFNNAGVGAGGLVWENTQADWEWVLGVNLWGVIHSVRVFTPMMLAHGEPAHIVNTASAAGFVAMGNTAPYALSKHAVVALSEVLYHDLCDVSSNVRASVLCPAWVATNLWNAERNRPSALRTRAATEDDQTRRLQVKAVLEKSRISAAEIAAIRAESAKQLADQVAQIRAESEKLVNANVAKLNEQYAAEMKKLMAANEMPTSRNCFNIGSLRACDLSPALNPPP